MNTEQIIRWFGEVLKQEYSGNIKLFRSKLSL